jgi:ubiquinone/menaquinone biosynthesis C-methylase UbiE
MNPMIYDFIQRLLDNPKKKKELIKNLIVGNVIDIGCGTGFYSDLTEDYIGVDNDEDLIKYCAKKWPNRHFILCDIRNLKTFNNKSFETTICIDVLHHLSDDDVKKTLSEIARITSNKVIILDTIKEQNPLCQLINTFDKGKFIREWLDEYNLLEKYLEIKDYDFNNFGLYNEVIFLCQTKK